MPPLNRTRESTRVPLFAALLVASVALLLGFAYATVVTQHATGIFSQGQARWMEAHLRTVMYLHRYARRGEPESLAQARAQMRIPGAYRRARRHLAPGRTDREAAIRAFVEGELPRADAERAARFSRLFEYLPAARGVLGSWELGDAQLDTLMRIGDSLEQAHARGDSAALRALIPRIEAADSALTRFERTFAGGLADMSRVIPPIVLMVGAVLGALLVAAGVIVVRSVARTADQARAAQLAYFRRLQALMDGVPDIIAWVDRDGRFTYVNAAMERLVGMPGGTIVDAPAHTASTRLGVAAGHVREWDDALRRTFAGESDVMKTLEVPGAGGRTHVLQFRFAAQRADGGEVETVMAIGRDITLLRASEEALREREAQLRHAQKLEAVGRLAGGVAHEFNNILTAITANIELAMLDLPEASETRKELLTALAAARRAGGLTRQLLVLGRRDTVELRPVDLARLLTELEPMLQRLAGDNVSVVMTQGTPRPAILGDAGQLQQIIFNLVSNARDAMPDGGTMQIDVGATTAGALRRDKSVVSGELDAAPPDAPWIALTVSDTGTGMTKETVDRLFEPFFTTKGPGAGSGLGLPVVNGIVMQLGGCICVETTPGAGSAVTVAFPLAADEPVQQDERDGSIGAHAVFGVADGRAPVGTGELVLLVEDEAAVRAAARRMLEHAGYRVVEAKHADDALLQWAKAPADIVVTDFMMPGLTGAELLACLRAAHPALPALIVSGYTGGDTIDEAALGERTALLQKPFTRTALLQHVRDLLDMR